MKKLNLTTNDEENTVPNAPTVEVDNSVVNQLEPEAMPEPKQVEPVDVVFMPLKDFEGRVNQNTYRATKGVPVRIPRDVANIWLEDDSRGYIRD